MGAEAPGEVGGLGLRALPRPASWDVSRREVIQILKDLKQKHPDKELEQAGGHRQLPRAAPPAEEPRLYRIQATRLMTGAGNVLRRHAVDASRRHPG